jgi:hypothetical protein
MHNAAMFLADKTTPPKLSHLLILVGEDVKDDVGAMDAAKASLAIADLDAPTKLNLANRLMSVGEDKLKLEMDPDAMMWKNELPTEAETSWIATKLAQAATDTMGIPIEKDGERGIRAAAFREGKTMKITRKQLWNLISEEVNQVVEAKKKRSKTTKVPYGDDTRDDAWSGGDNLVDPIDWDKALDMIKERKGSMSITASQLRQIIREELGEVGRPEPWPAPGLDFIGEDSEEEETRHYRDNEEEDEKHLRDLEKDIDFDKAH